MSVPATPVTPAANPVEVTSLPAAGNFELRHSRPSAAGRRKYLNIVRELAIADFRMKYHDSVLGYIWSMLNPLVMFAVYFFVFTKIFPNKIDNFPLFLIIGVVNYTFFQDCTFSGMSALGGRAGLMKKIYFPRAIIIWASSSTSLISYLINMSLLLCIIGYVKGFTVLAFLAIVPMLCLVLFSVGLAFLLASFYAFFRDMGQIWGVATLLLFWLSPVVYNAETLPPPISTLVYFNPLTRIFVLMRHCLLYNYLDLRFVLMTVVYSALAFLVGYFVFSRYEKQFPELF
jgi:ABC-type polysaccharide/polyol phosphate export permease